MLAEFDATAERPPTPDGARVVRDTHDQQRVAAANDADGNGADDGLRPPRRGHVGAPKEAQGSI
jgi:hypothetical protein